MIPSSVAIPSFIAVHRSTSVFSLRSVRMASTTASRLLSLSLLCVVLRYSTTASLEATPHKLLVILLDGFRWDYTSKANLINFQRLITEGVHADYAISDFPTLSYPNYYTLMTGLHTGTHGMTGNFMYDPVTGQYFLIGDNPEKFDSHWWDGGEPLWVTAVKQNKKAYMYHWPGCDVTIRGTNSTFCEPYVNPTIRDFGSSLQAAKDSLIENNGADLALVYHEDPDYSGHKYGPDSAEVVQALQDIDSELGKLLISLDNLPEENKVNLVIVSDHGMTPIDPSRTINLTTVLPDLSLVVTIVEAGSIASIYTNSTANTDQVYALIKDFSPRMQVYKRNEIPDRYSYKDGPYVGDITCVADNGWFILHPYWNTYPMKDGKMLKGYHGYDNKEEDMRGIFYAYGPFFKKGAKINEIRNVDPYNLMCNILGLSAAPNQGSNSTWQSVVNSSGRSSIYVCVNLALASSLITLCRSIFV